MSQWLSWLERRPVTAEVEGSSPFWVVFEDSDIYQGPFLVLGNFALILFTIRVTNCSIDVSGQSYFII